MATDKNESLKALESEAERRRKDAAEKAKVPLPSYIKSVESTSVTYTFNPKILPFSLVDPKKLSENLKGKYKLRFKRPAIDPNVMKQLGIDPSNVTEDVMFTLLIDTEDPRLIFENGRYPTGPNSFVPIETVAFTDQNVLAKVSGVTEVAQVVIEDSFNLFWEASGGAKRWHSDDIQDNVHLVSFRTTTKADVAGNVRGLLNGGLCDYLDKNVAKEVCLGARMSAYSRYEDFKPSENLAATWSFDELSIQVHVFNTITGRSETSVINIDTRFKDERGRGIVEITTDLPFDDHVKLVEALVKIVNGQAPVS